MWGASEQRPRERIPPATANRLAGTITMVTEESSIVRIDLDAGFPLIAFVTRRDHAVAGFGVGMKVAGVIEPSALHLVHP